MKDSVQLGSRGSSETGVERRILLAVLLIIAVWLTLSARLFYLQVVEGDRYRVSAEKNSVRTQRVYASRGMILDRNGEILVDSRPAFDVRLVPDQAEDIGGTLERLSSLLNEDRTVLAARFGRPRGRFRYQPILVAHDIDYVSAARVGARLWALPGVITRADPVRSYVYDGSASHILGMLGEISQDELNRKEFQAYRRGDIVGKDGIERLLDRELRGRDGGRNVLVDAYGRELEVLDEIRPQPGNNVVLTLDHRLQSVAEQALEETGRNGAVVALDPRNGDVLAIASRPTFDPNRFARGIAASDWKALLRDPDKPMHHRALLGQFPPGSTYKVIPAIAGLEAGVITPNTVIQCNGRYRLGRGSYRCWKRGGHGPMDLHRALVQSCDVYFYKVAELLERERRGVDELAYYARAFGLGSKTGIDARRESAGLVPTRDWKERRFREKWQMGETISVAIGQGFNLWTPMQLAMVYGAIGNGGTRYRPTLVKRVESPFGEVIERGKPEVVGTVPVKPESLEIVRRALEGVVHDPRGTGSRMRDLPAGIRAAGKTGTAQVIGMGKEVVDSDDLPEQFRDHAWFATFVPARDPRIVVAVLVEHGGHGGSAAAPLARAVVDEFLKHQPDLVPPEEVPQVEPPPARPTEPGPDPIPPQVAELDASTDALRAPRLREQARSAPSPGVPEGGRSRARN